MTALAVAAMPRPVRTLACSFVVHGEPIPQGSKTPRVIPRKSGPPIVTMFEANPRLEPWRKHVAACARQAVGSSWAALDCPMAIALAFTMPKPASYPKTRRSWPSASYDIDKCARAILDSLKHANVVTNDSRFVHLTAAQHFPREDPDALPVPGVRIAIWTLSEPAEPTLLDGAM